MRRHRRTTTVPPSRGPSMRGKGSPRPASKAGEPIPYDRRTSYAFPMVMPAAKTSDPPTMTCTTENQKFILKNR